MTEERKVKWKKTERKIEKRTKYKSKKMEKGKKMRRD